MRNLLVESWIQMLEMLMNLDTKEEGVRTLVRLMVAGILADFLSERFQVRTGA